MRSTQKDDGGCGRRQRWQPTWSWSRPGAGTDGGRGERAICSIPAARMSTCATNRLSPIIGRYYQSKSARASYTPNRSGLFSAAKHQGEVLIAVYGLDRGTSQAGPRNDPGRRIMFFVPIGSTGWGSTTGLICRIRKPMPGEEDKFGGRDPKSAVMPKIAIWTFVPCITVRRTRRGRNVEALDGEGWVIRRGETPSPR